MVLTGFFDFTGRFSDLSKIGDPLEKINKVIAWESFRKTLETIIPRKNKTSKGGRPSYDCVLMFKIIILQTLYTLSYDQIELQIKDRLTFMRFLNLSLTDKVPDAKTIWLFREYLVKNNGIEKLFNKFEEMLIEAGFFARSGQLVDATIVEAPKRRMSKKDNELVKKGKNPKNWDKWSKAKKKTEQIWMLDGLKRAKDHILVTKII